MSELPYFQIIGNIPRYFAKIKTASTPDRFDYKFVKDVLGFRSSNDQRLIGVLKSMELIDASGIPTKRYTDFRSEEIPSKTLGEGVKTAYQALFVRNVDAHKASEEEIKGHVLSITGIAATSPLVRLITNSFLELRKLSDFTEREKRKGLSDEEKKNLPIKIEQASQDSADLKLTYTLVLNLAATTNREVYDTLFASLKENLLKN